MAWLQDAGEIQYSSKPSDFAEAVTEGRLHAIHWDDFIADATTLTHLRETGRGLIEINLGYLPPDDVMLPYEPYLRALVQGYWQGTIAEDDFFQQVEHHIKIIRNADMKHNVSPVYDDAIYKNYNKTFSTYGYAVKDRLTRFLGYVPQLEHSLIAEMWMRDIMADDTYHLPEEMTPDDIRALTLIKYREFLLKDGQAEADKSPLLTDMIATAALKQRQ
ncbi:hypothetical protein [Spirosoma pollinicola]|uniref:Uncharacterized protein n=1 Tax=Spirosoma pollinicola TaxID=2057025 RepID=A0A2K8YX99_9BACT|nr:hypothetical protein [Spirosoma pollinicola]AUD02168.1 hypothetical protein CWM47_10255 [Spirosoma pollinicola]